MRYTFIIALTLICSSGFTQDSLQVITLSDKVGEVIDSTEKKEYRLFPYYSSKDFESAQLFRMKDSSIVLKAILKNGASKEKNISSDEYWMMKVLVGEAKHGGVSYQDKIEKQGGSVQKTNEAVIAEKMKKKAIADTLEMVLAPFKKERRRRKLKTRIVGSILLAGAGAAAIGTFRTSDNYDSLGYAAVGIALGFTGTTTMAIGSMIANHKYRKAKRERLARMDKKYR